MSDLWATPLPIFSALHAEFEFALDVCATASNAKCRLFIAEQQDSITVDWRKYLSTGGGRNDYAPSADDRYPAWCWCNPPYSNIGPWVQKAAYASRASNLGVVMLVMADTSVGWFAEAMQTVSEVRFITATPKDNGNGYHGGRISFLDGDGQPVGGNNKGSMLLIWRPGISGNGNPVVRFESLTSLQRRGQSWLDVEEAERKQHEAESQRKALPIWHGCKTGDRIRHLLGDGTSTGTLVLLGPNDIGYMIPDTINGKPNPYAGSTDIKKGTVQSVCRQNIEIISDEEAA